jgi:molecular chaperone HscB
LDPFVILGIPPSFDVDLAALEQRHRDLSRALHPDRYLGAGPSERRDALTRAMEVNEAWRIVRDPISRAEALLRLAGAAPSEGREPAQDPDFLMEMMEQREALSDAVQAKDRSAVTALGATIRARSKEVETALLRGFARGEHANCAGKLGELRFYRRFLDEVSAVEDDL